MTGRTLGRVALKVLGVYWLLSGLYYALQATLIVLSPLQVYGPGETSQQVIHNLVSAAIQGLVGVLAIVLANWLTVVLKLDESTYGISKDDIYETNILSVGLTLLGLFYAIPSLATFVGHLVRAYTQDIGYTEF